MARRLQFTVDQEPILIEIGGEEFTAPPVLAPAALGDLLDKRTTMNTALAGLNGDDVERTAMDTILAIMAYPPTCPRCGATLSPHKARHPVDGAPGSWTPVCPSTTTPYQPDTGIFDVIFSDEKTAQRFRERLYSRDRPFDMTREVMPAIIALIEEYTGRPTPPSPSSSTPSPGDGTASTDGAPSTAWTPSQISTAAVS